MLIFPTEPPDARVPRRFHDRDPQHLSVDPAARGPALLAREVDQRLLGDRFHQTVPEQIEGESRRADGLRVGYPLLNLRVGERGIRADGPIVDEGAAGDDDRAPGNRDVCIAELSIGAQVTDAQFADLARSAGGRVLVALPA